MNHFQVKHCNAVSFEDFGEMILYRRKYRKYDGCRAAYEYSDRIFNIQQLSLLELDEEGKLIPYSPHMLEIYAENWKRYEQAGRILALAKADDSASNSYTPTDNEESIWIPLEEVESY